MRCTRSPANTNRGAKNQSRSRVLAMGSSARKRGNAYTLFAMRCACTSERVITPGSGRCLPACHGRPLGYTEGRYLILWLPPPHSPASPLVRRSQNITTCTACVLRRV